MANRRWASEVAAGRPYRDALGLLDASAIQMDAITDAEWREALEAHPRLGERGGDAPATSAHEQSRVLGASSETLAQLAAENRRYERKFGHVFLIAASGRSAEEILGELRRRMKNSAATELEEAKRELRQIAQSRLGRLLRQ